MKYINIKIAVQLWRSPMWCFVDLRKVLLHCFKQRHSTTELIHIKHSHMKQSSLVEWSKIIIVKLCKHFCWAQALDTGTLPNNIFFFTSSNEFWVQFMYYPFKLVNFASEMNTDYEIKSLKSHYRSRSCRINVDL